jgi:hypothetical protein
MIHSVLVQCFGLCEWLFMRELMYDSRLRYFASEMIFWKHALQDRMRIPPGYVSKELI